MSAPFGLAKAQSDDSGGGEGGGSGHDLGNQFVKRHGRVNVNPGCMPARGEGVPGTDMCFCCLFCFFVVVCGGGGGSPRCKVIDLFC